MALADSANGVDVGRKVVATAGTAEALSTSNTRIFSVAIQAETDNTGLVVVGDSTVVAALATRKGIALNAGDSITLDVAQLSNIYIDVTVNGDGVTYLAATNSV